MKMDTKYALTKALSYVLAFILAFSIIVLVFSGLTMGFIQSKGYVVNQIQSHESEIISEINREFDDKSEFLTLSPEVFQNALSEGDTRIIVEKAVENMLYNYSTDFSSDNDIYALYKSGMTRYCQNNNIDISNKEIEKNAALAVDIVDEALGGNATSQIKLYRTTGSSRMMYIIVAPIILMIASWVILDIINYGRHRKYSYIGLGIVTSGYTLTAVSVLIKSMEFTKKYKFCTIDVYNMGIADTVDAILSVMFIIGITLSVVGLFLLIHNYRYFLNRNREMIAVHEHNEVLRGEYMDELVMANPKKPTAPRNKEDKEVTKIDF